MARYYTVCRFTPDVSTSHYSTQEVYARAASGFIFHDTEEVLKPDDIRRALFVLGELFEDSTSAWVISVTPQILAVTFSGASIPAPVTVGSSWDPKNQYEWLQRSDLSGWLLANAKDPSAALVPINYNSLYSNCTDLSRLSGLCPCPKQLDNTCVTDVVYPNVKDFISVDRLKCNYAELENHTFSRVRYAKVGGFTYVSPAKTTRHDFAEGLRAWNSHDFSHVEHRTSAFKARGMRRHLNVLHRKEACTKCAFSPDPDKGNDCGQVSRCQGPVTEGHLWAYLHRWFENSGFDRMDGFTADQRNYLISRGGVKTRMAFHRSARKSSVNYGGFIYRGGLGWNYVISGAVGDRSRREYFSSYSNLQARLGSDELPIVPPQVSIAYLTLLACAIGGWNDVISSLYKPNRRTSTVELSHSEVVFTGNSTRYGANILCIQRDGPATHYHDILHGEYQRGSACLSTASVQGT